ncbi:Maf family protein [Lacticaseibacillus daqingensis]|uniref:Maf family protein n=1 Tax=Lacticaseibacillus daqingensis TaxID=2486014 RepID=UPI000F7765A8|nr:Maf family protein [Lacticaseibacillus daqingensis]
MIILASSSPRRRELLSRLVPDFTVVPAAIDERALPVLAPAPYVQSLAIAKAQAVAALHPAATVIAADTMCYQGADLLGKPKDRADAARMLRQLAGTTHHCATGLAIARPGQPLQTAVVTTAVTFWPLDDAAIDRYLDTGEYRDKAGAYGIQGQGALLVRAIDGDFYNIVGLPIATLGRMLHGLALD